MDTKKFITGTVVGGVVFFFLGFITYAIVLPDFFAAHAGSALGVSKEELAYWPLIIGDLSQAAMLTYIFLKWAKVKTFSEGLRAGLAIGFFMMVGHNMIAYDTTNIMDFTAAVTDTLVYTLIVAIVGGVIAAVIGTGGTTSPTS